MRSMVESEKTSVWDAQVLLVLQVGEQGVGDARRSRTWMVEPSSDEVGHVLAIRRATSLSPGVTNS